MGREDRIPGQHIECPKQLPCFMSNSRDQFHCLWAGLLSSEVEEPSRTDGHRGTNPSQRTTKRRPKMADMLQVNSRDQVHCLRVGMFTSEVEKNSGNDGQRGSNQRLQDNREKAQKAAMFRLPLETSSTIYGQDCSPPK